jgi:hypothetical protein
MDNQQVPKADSKFQKIARKNHRKWKLRLLSKGGQKADSGGGPHYKKPDYNRAKSAPPGFGGLEERIIKKGSKYCLMSKKSNKNLGCYSSRKGAMNREKQVQYFKHLKETIIREELYKALLEEGFLDDVVNKGKELYSKFTSMFSGDVKPSANLEELVSKYNLDPKADLSLGRRELQAKFGGFEGYIEFLWKMFDENKSSLSGWSRDKTIDLIKQIAPKYGVEPYIIIGTMMGESGGMPVGIYSQTMGSKGNPQSAISANSSAYGMGQIVHSTYESVKNQIGVPHYMIWIPEYSIEATIALIAKLIKQRGSLESAMASYAGSAGGGERKIAAIEKAKSQYGGLAEAKKKEDRCTRIAKRKYKAWPSAYASGAVVKCRQGKIWKSVKEEGQELEEEWSEKYKKSIDCKHPKGFSQKAHCQGRKKNEKVELEERKLGKPSSETNLGDWFKRKGSPGKGGGWVDCNTCRDGKCKPCGRQEGEKRSKYPRCRPTPSQCKGYKRRGSNLQREE